MSTQQYEDHKFKPESLRLIDVMNTIVDEYIAANYRLTVRQLYYQLVARGVIPNTERSYKNTTSLVNDAKLAGLMDWEAIEDRTRSFIRRQRWDSAASIVRAAADSFHMDMWADQPCRVFCIVEKEALAGVLDRACRAYDVPLLAARGYPSGTVLREFCVADIMPYCGEQAVRILHLGDHDPSGIDMTRDLQERLSMFLEIADPEIRRKALNLDQVEKWKLPPNPTNPKDARFAGYVRKFGRKCWELDAIEPEELQAICKRSIERLIDWPKWDRRKAEIAATSKRIRKHAAKFKG